MRNKLERTFQSDIALGESYEQNILKIIQKEFPEACKNTDEKTREFYDLVIPASHRNKEIRFEIKADVYESKNLAFECLGNYGVRNSGIIKTTAQFWVQFRADRYLIWNILRLKPYLLNAGTGLRWGGDGKATAMWVIDEAKVLTECPPNVIQTMDGNELNKYLLARI